MQGDDSDRFPICRRRHHQETHGLSIILETASRMVTSGVAKKMRPKDLGGRWEWLGSFSHGIFSSVSGANARLMIGVVWRIPKAYEETVNKTC